MKKIDLIFLSCLLLILMNACLKKTEIDEPSSQPFELTLDQQNIVDDVNEYASLISGAEHNLAKDELSPLNKLGEARIVGFGEATHGTKEFFQMKHRLFRYLVEEHGFKAIAFEMDFAEAMIFNEYVLTGKGDLEKLMRDKMLFWTWRTTEVRDLLEWMKEYNESRVDEAKIQFWGVDTQFNTYNAPFLIEKLEGIDSILHRQAKILTSSFQLLEFGYYRDKTEEFRNGIKNDVESLLQLIEDQQQLIIQKTSEKEYQLIRQLAYNIIQAEATIYDQNIPESVNLRDQYMAENQLWLLDYLGPDTRICSWAHNSHVANNIYFGKGGSMGYNLRQNLGDEYQIIAFSFSKGAFTAFNNFRLVRNVISEDPVLNSFNFYFYHADFDNFILDLSTLPRLSDLGKLINKKTRFLGIGATFDGEPLNYYALIELKRYYNIIIHFDKTEDSDLL